MKELPTGEVAFPFGLPHEKGRWILIALGMIISLCLGTLYSWSVFVEPLTEYFSDDLGQAVTANEVLLPFSTGVGRPIFGMLTDRITPRTTAMLSFVLIADGGYIM